MTRKSADAPGSSVRSETDASASRSGVRAASTGPTAASVSAAIAIHVPSMTRAPVTPGTERMNPIG